MPKFLTPINLSNLEIQNVLLQNVPTVSLPTTNRAGQILYDSTVNRPKWNNGSGFIDIYPSDTANTANTEVRRDGSGNFSAGTITASLTGVASQATILATARNIGISGTKVTATAASFNGSADVNINITALSVAVGDIALASGSFIVGSAGNVGSATAKSSIPLSGFGAAGADVAMGNFKITGLADPTNAQDAATKNYVDSTSQGLDVKASVRAATTAALAVAYVGTPTFTLTNAGTQAALVIDGVTLAVNDRVLVKNQTTASQNGIYVVTAIGSVSANWVLTRASDFNTSAKASPGSFTFVEEGATLSDTGWVMSTDGVVTLDSTVLSWAQFSGAGSYLAGRGIVRNGNSFHFAQDANYTIGDLPYATGGATIGLLAAVATGNVLISAGIGTAPVWGKVDLGTVHVQGTLPVSRGGTGATAVTNNGVAIGSGGVYAFTAAMTAGQILLANASAVPTPTSVTGDVTITNAGVTAVGANKVTMGMLAQISGLSILGNSAASAANVGAITGTANQVLRVDSAGTTLGFGSINLASTSAVTGILPVANGGTGLSAVGAQYTVLSSTGSAATWTSVDLNNMTSGTLPVSKGGTGSTFFTVAGPTATRTYTFKDQNANIPALFAAQITADSSTTAFAITHNLGTKDVIVAVYEISTGARVYTDDTATSTSAVTVTFATAPVAGTNYRVVIVGF